MKEGQMKGVRARHKRDDRRMQNFSKDIIEDCERNIKMYENER
jgi:hypothetical protein